MTPVRIWFCRKVNAESFEKKFSPKLKIGRDIEKILTPPFILPHPLFRK